MKSILKEAIANVGLNSDLSQVIEPLEGKGYRVALDYIQFNLNESEGFVLAELCISADLEAYSLCLSFSEFGENDGAWYSMQVACRVFNSLEALFVSAGEEYNGDATFDYDKNQVQQFPALVKRRANLVIREVQNLSKSTSQLCTA